MWSEPLHGAEWGRGEEKDNHCEVRVELLIWDVGADLSVRELFDKRDRLGAHPPVLIAHVSWPVGSP